MLALVALAVRLSGRLSFGRSRGGCRGSGSGCRRVSELGVCISNHFEDSLGFDASRACGVLIGVMTQTCFLVSTPYLLLSGGTGDVENLVGVGQGHGGGLRTRTLS